jgi:2-desacetyl-2-hydroxyethyl bacteriochlorophyllide A dehydrogenase
MGESGRALWFTAPKTVEIRSEKIVPGPGDVIVCSRLMGISHGTEMLFYRGTVPENLSIDENLTALNGSTGYPVKYGYINVGIAEGKRRVFAFCPHQDVFSAPSEDLIDLPEQLSFEDAVFLAHAETAVSIVQDLNPVIGETVLVLGQGTVGLMTAEILSRLGSVRVFTVDPIAMRREASEKLGCPALDPADKDLREKLMQFTEGRGVDAAVNVSGSPAALQLAVDVLGFEATVVEASWYGSKPLALNLGAAFHRNRLRIRSSQVSNIAARLSGRWDKRRRMKLALDWIGLLKPSKFITDVYTLQNAAEAYRMLDEHPERTLQVVLKP